MRWLYHTNVKLEKNVSRNGTPAVATRWAGAPGPRDQDHRLIWAPAAGQR
jgi:hypothetical protein